MLNLIKRITSVVVAVATMVAITIPASAATKTFDLMDRGGIKVKGVLSVDSSNYCYGAITVYGASSNIDIPLRIRVAVDVADSSTGERYCLLDSGNKTNTNHVSVGTKIPDDVTVNIFGCFEVMYDGIPCSTYVTL